MYGYKVVVRLRYSAATVASLSPLKNPFRHHTNECGYLKSSLRSATQHFSSQHRPPHQQICGICAPLFGYQKHRQGGRDGEKSERKE